MKKLFLCLLLLFPALQASKNINDLNDESHFEHGSLKVDSGNTLNFVKNKAQSPITILFIHGNSMCKEVFTEQLTSPLLQNITMIAVDLPGHGLHQDHIENPRRTRNTYSFKGYATDLYDFCVKQNLENVIVCGWSLGGHIAIEMAVLDELNSTQIIKGLCLTGTPPTELSLKGVQQGFKGIEGETTAAYPQQFTHEMARKHVGELADNPWAQFMITAAMNADPQSRSLMIKAMINGTGGVNQKDFIEKTHLPIIIVQGKNDPYINNDYIRSLNIQNLLDFFLLPTTHETFLQAPKLFNAHLHTFVKNISTKLSS